MIQFYSKRTCISHRSHLHMKTTLTAKYAVHFKYGNKFSLGQPSYRIIYTWWSQGLYNNNNNVPTVYVIKVLETGGRYV